MTDPLVQDWQRTTGFYAGTADQGRALHKDVTGNLYIAQTARTPAGDLNIGLVKLLPDGTQVWAAEYGGHEGLDDVPRQLWVDALGNVYVIGSTMKQGGSTDTLVLRFDGQGNLSGEWPDDGHGPGVRTFDGDAEGFDTGLLITGDANGFVYLAGSAVGSDTFQDIFLYKLNQSGTRLWQVVYDGPGNFTDFPVALTLLPDGNCLLLGESAGDTTEADWVLLQYDSNGNAASHWPDNGGGTGVRRYNKGGNSFDTPAAFQVDEMGGIYVAGTVNPIDGSEDMALAKFDAGGTLVWSVSYDGTGIGSDRAVTLRRWGSDGLVLAGNSAGSGTGMDMALLLITSGGDFSAEWPDAGEGVGVRRFTSDGGFADVLTGLEIDSSGFLFVGGYSFEGGTADDAVVLVYRQDGELVGSKKYDGGDGASERTIGLALQSGPRVTLAGTSFANAGDDDVFTVSFGIKPLLKTVPEYLFKRPGTTHTFVLPGVNPEGRSYEWYRNGNLIADQGHELPLLIAGSGEAGEYVARVGNVYGSLDYVVGEITVVGLGWSPGQGATLSLTGKAGAALLIDYADTLAGGVIWTPLTNLTLGAGTSMVTDTAANGLGKRFYRIRRVAGE